MKLHVLASGSKGNASLIEDTDTGKAILIDCGICKRDFFTRCDEVGFDPHNLEAIFVTHEHTDHTKGLGVVTRGLAKDNISPTIFVSRAVYRSSKDLVALKNDCAFKELIEEDNISVAGMNVHPFATSHDSSESFGFRIEGRQKKVLGFITDNGISSEKALAYLANCSILALESNHDEKMLAQGDYPYMVKKRISSDRGHLSNTQATEMLETLLHEGLQQVVAMHISENNNTYTLPKKMFQEIADRNSHPVKVSSSYQHMVTSVF